VEGLSAGEAEHSLVIGSKSPTFFDLPLFVDELGEHEIVRPEIEYTGGDPGKFIDLKKEDWSGEYSAVAIVQQRVQQEPPPQSGDRWTDKVSQGAKRKITKSAKYLHLEKRGYRAFVTLTFTPAQRAMLELHDKYGAFNIGKLCGPVIPKRTSIGKEVSRFLNALQERRKKGMTIKLDPNDKKSKRARIRGTERAIDYCWVIECPWTVRHTVYGPGRAKNPHVHLMMNWTVKRASFRGWASRIESIWGNGYAKIEKLRKPASAAGYMAKAAGYLSKGADGKQGKVRGNRYGISKGARAPLARSIGRYALQFMRDAIRAGVDAGRKCWPKGVYFHAHGFGASDDKAWGSLWRVLKLDGFKFMTAHDFFVASMKETVSKYLARLRVPDYLIHNCQEEKAAYNYYSRYELVTH